MNNGIIKPVAMLLVIVIQGGLSPLLHRMEMMLIKNHFDFKDLMNFGTGY